MAKKNKAFMLNRKQYMQIRKMDHCQLSAWVEAVYKNAFKDGRESAEGLGEAEMKDFVQRKARLAVDYGEWFGAGGRGFIRLNLATTLQWVEKAVDGLVEAARSL